MARQITKEEFESLSPTARGYYVYMCGSREDQPNIPDEENPYPPGSEQAKQWDNGQTAGVLEAQDSEE